MGTEIFIEGQPSDLTADVSALFTYAVSDVTDPASRDTNYSKTIVFPGTGRNGQIFGHAFELTARNVYDPSLPNVGVNFNAAKTAKCLVLVHGIQVFKGVMRLMEIKMLDGAIEYETAVFGELGGLISAIGNRKLTGNTGGLTVADDLDFSSYDEAWTLANMITSWSNLAALGYRGYGVLYPSIDYGLCTLNRIDFCYQAMRPALYVHEYIVKIFEKAGYTFTCPFFETPFFLRLIIPHNEDQVYKLVRMLVDHRRVVASTVTGTGVLSSAGSSSAVLAFPTPVEINNFTAGGLGASTFTYNAGQPPLPVNALVAIDLYKTSSAVQVEMELLLNGVTVDRLFFSAIAGLPARASFYLQYSGLINASDVFSVAVVATTPGIAPPTWDVFFERGRITVEAQYAVAAPAGYGATLSINNMVPKGVLQKDFLLSIVKMFNLCIIEDTNKTKHVNIVPFPDFFNNSNPLDWTYKVDRSREISLKPMSEVNARYFNFLYEKDGDLDNDTYFKRYSAGYGDRTHDVGLDFVKDKKDLKIIFAPSPLVGVLGNDKTVTRIMKLESSAEARTESKIRILQAKRIAVGSWNVLQDDLSTVIGSTTYYGYAGHVDDPDTPQGADLNFGAPAEIYWTPANPYTAPNLFNAFYSIYMAEITDKDSKLLTCFVRLSPVDIAQLDFSKSIIIDGALFRLNKIVDFDTVADGVTKTELLRVINILY